MFDRLVESRAAGAAESRKSYFVVSTLAMSVISLTAVVVSIFADDYALNTSFELSELIAPVEMAQVAPEQPRQPMPRTQQVSSSQIATRTDNVRDIAEVTDQVPPISTLPTNSVSRPLDVPFRISGTNTDPGAGAGRGTPNGNGIGSNGISSPPAGSQTATEEAPPAVKNVEPTVPKKISLGVINGKAELLPLPTYPATARAVGAQGQVSVEVTIDESGRVISAHASSGNPLLKAAAEDAARRAKFSPTYLSKIPVKVTGVIIYNFNRG